MNSLSVKSVNYLFKFGLRGIIMHRKQIAAFILPCAGYTRTTFVDADIVSQCYPVNNENYCFYTGGSVLSWNKSREFCAGRNSTLPIITDEAIDSVFQQFIVNDAYIVIQNTSVWIDAHARPVNSSVNWHWINGRPSGNDNDK